MDWFSWAEAREPIYVVSTIYNNLGVVSENTADIQVVYIARIQARIMSALSYAIIAILIAGAIGFLVGLARYYSDRTAFFEKAERDRIKAEEDRVRACESVLYNFKATYGHLGELNVPEDKIARMIEGGAPPEAIGNVLKSCLTVPGFINLGGSQDQPLGVLLSPTVRNHHMYIIGKSGSGKTNLMRHMILQDLAAGSGLGILAPEFEMLRDQVLPFIPENRLKDVVYFDPSDMAYPVIINPLHPDARNTIDLQVDETFTILERIVGEGGNRMDEILRNCLYALIERPGSSLEDLDRLLDRDDHTLRNEIIRTTERERIRRFFSHTYPTYPKDAHLPIMHRIGRFVGTDYVRNCLCPPRDTSLSTSEVSKRYLNIRNAMDEGKILLFNLSDGLLGTATSQLIGQFIVSKFQTATMSRADVPEDKRRPFYLYLDEFQNFCGTASQSYENTLSRARKYGLGMVLAHQQTHQIPQPLLHEIFGNVSTLVSFQVSHSDATSMVKHLGLGKTDDAASLLTHLPRGTCYCRIENYTTQVRVPLVTGKPNSGIRERVIEHSRNNYGIPRRAAKGGFNSKDTQAPPSQLSDLDPGSVFE